MDKITEKAILEAIAKKNTGTPIEEDLFYKLKKKHKKLVSPESYLFNIDLVEALLKTVKAKGAKYLGVHLGADEDGTLRLILSGSDKFAEVISKNYKPPKNKQQVMASNITANASHAAEVYFVDKTDPFPPPPPPPKTSDDN